MRGWARGWDILCGRGQTHQHIKTPIEKSIHMICDASGADEISSFRLEIDSLYTHEPVNQPARHRQLRREHASHNTSPTSLRGGGMWRAPWAKEVQNVRRTHAIHKQKKQSPYECHTFDRISRKYSRITQLFIKPKYIRVIPSSTPGMRPKKEKT